MKDSRVVSLDNSLPVASVGGKAFSLTKMIQAGFPVAGGFAITTEAHAKMDASLKKTILKRFDELGAPYVAVRSSAVAEDGKDAAWAGQMDTFLNINRDELIEAIIRCWDSANSERAKAYAIEKKLEVGPVAVLIQEMIQGSTSGIAFSVNPITQNPGQVIIEAGLGLNEPIVSGEITPDTYTVDKGSGNISQKYIATQTKQLIQGLNGKNFWQSISNGVKQKLTDEQISKVTKTVVKLEKYFGTPVDVEWTFTGQQLFILQSRPITTLG